MSGESVVKQVDTSGAATDRPVGDTEIRDADSPDAVALPVDMTFDLLKNQRRRRVVRYLLENDGPVRLGELSEHIAAQENDKAVAAISSSERKRVYVGLYQCHLPKMDDLDVVTFNKDRGIIELGANASHLVPYLERESETERPWHRYYAALAAGGAVLFAASLLLPDPLTVGVLTAVVLAFVACATAHLYATELSDADGLPWPRTDPREASGGSLRAMFRW